jgi:hypothetical protein
MRWLRHDIACIFLGFLLGVIAAVLVQRTFRSSSGVLCEADAQHTQNILYVGHRENMRDTSRYAVDSQGMVVTYRDPEQAKTFARKVRQFVEGEWHKGQ